MAHSRKGLVMQVELFKKKGTYEKDGKVLPFTNYYLQCGDSMIPIEVKNFSTKEKQDYNYSARKGAMSAFATPIPETE